MAKKKLSIAKLAEDMGYSRSHLTAVIHGRRVPSLALALALEERGVVKFRRLRRSAPRWV